MSVFIFSLLSFCNAGCPFGFDKAAAEVAPVAPKPETMRRRLQADLFPSGVFICPANEAVTTVSFSKADYQAVAEGVIAVYEATDDTVEDNFNPRATLVGCVVRYAGHDFMDFRTNLAEGGSDGCINFEDADNSGLKQCMFDSGLPDVYAAHCQKVSLADFIVIMGEALMARTATTHNEADLFAEGTLARTFRDNFKFGRTTNHECHDNTGLMPNPEHGCPGLKSIFNDHIYANSADPWRLTAAISGAHTVGSAHIENSGYEGFWSSSDEQGKFNNDYYKALLLKGWAPKIGVNGNDGKNQWDRVDLATNLNHLEFMLDTDMCLAYGLIASPPNGPLIDELGFSATAPDLNLNDEGTCCVWLDASELVQDGLLENGDSMCGTTNFFIGAIHNACCEHSTNGFGEDCNHIFEPQGPAIDHVKDFILDEANFYSSFMEAWNIATNNGFTALSSLSDEPVAAPEVVETPAPTPLPTPFPSPFPTPFPSPAPSPFPTPSPVVPTPHPTAPVPLPTPHPTVAVVPTPHPTVAVVPTPHPTTAMVPMPPRYTRTSCNLMRNRKVEYLDRHNVKCKSDEILTRHRVGDKWCAGSRMRVWYTCRKTTIVSRHHRKTSCTQLRHEHLEFFDRQHHIGCHEGEALQRWRLVKGECYGNNMQFEITCAKLGNPSYHAEFGTVVEKKTNCEPIEHKRLEYLDRHNILCPGTTGWAMKSFRMVKDGCYGNQQRFKYTCIKFDPIMMAAGRRLDLPLTVSDPMAFQDDAEPFEESEEAWQEELLMAALDELEDDDEDSSDEVDPELY